jgi:hypothetical protein
MARQDGPTPEAEAANLPPDAAVITVIGVCPAPAQTAASKETAKPSTTAKTATASADCKTVITKAEFEKLAGGIAPNMTPQVKRQLANILPRLIAMSSQAKKEGLDKSPRYEETLKFAKMQILSNELQRNIQDEAAKVSPEEIATYYKDHPETFEQFNLERIFVPRTKQGDAEAEDEDDKGDKDDKDDKNEKLTEEQQKAKQAEEKAKADEAELSMAKLAVSLRERAAAGEDFVKLQKEAFEASGMKIESPTVSLPKIRRTGLPPAHSTVFDLKVGEVSQPINDSGGHYIYKVVSEDKESLDQAKDEIRSTMQTQRARDMMDKVNGSFKAETNDAYFGVGPSTMPPPRGPNSRMAPGPMGPGAHRPTPPPAQPPAEKPD